jgi:hypothetical protein
MFVNCCFEYSESFGRFVVFIRTKEKSIRKVSILGSKYNILRKENFYLITIQLIPLTRAPAHLRRAFWSDSVFTFTSEFWIDSGPNGSMERS